MRKLASLAAAAIAVLAIGAAQAAPVVLTIDDFNSPGATIFDTNPANNAISASGTYSDSTRTITHNLLSPGPNPSDCTFSCVKFGTTTFPTGQFKVANETAADSTVTVSWNLAAGFVPVAAGSSFFFQVIDSDGNPITADMSFNGKAFETLVIPGNTHDSDLFFAIPTAQLSDLNGGGTLMLTLNGVAGWDLALDSFGLTTPAATVPEPASIALVSLGLLVAGAASRRRKVR
ncbi:MAG TPA: PEP-CTERM sorting domain-containing protein [Burkholderiaceae bacterium]|jgi:hypothetical protein